jgi:hypothetical protein
MQAGAAVLLPAAIAPPIHGSPTSVLQMLDQRQCSVLYRSPVQRCVVSLKFSNAPGPGELCFGMLGLFSSCMGCGSAYVCVVRVMYSHTA